MAAKKKTFEESMQRLEEIVSLLEKGEAPLNESMDLFEEGMRRYCKHSSLVYDGMLSERDLGYKATFLDPEKVHHARAFAHVLSERMEPA